MALKTLVLSHVLLYCASFSVTRGLRCGQRTCPSHLDYCCISSPLYSTNKICCASIHSDWALRGTGIGVALTVLLLLAVAICKCYRKFKRSRGQRRRTNNDLPPDYTTLKISVTEEPPPYYKLYPIPGTNPSCSTPPCDQTTDVPSTSTNHAVSDANQMETGFHATDAQSTNVNCVSGASKT